MKTRSVLFRFAALAGLWLAAPPIAAQPAVAPFTFTAFGCMPYESAPDSAASFARLIAEVNRLAPAFSVHLGDTLSGSEKATPAGGLSRSDWSGRRDSNPRP